MYKRCFTTACKSQPGVIVHKHRDSSLPFDTNTIFEIVNATGKGGGRARYLLNRASTVRLGANGFIAGPRKNGKIAICKQNGWVGTLAKAQARCEADPDCGFVHDSGCDGRRWRYCKGSADAQRVGNAHACIRIKVKSSGRSYSFRNPPNFMPLAGEIYYGSEGFDSAFRKPQVRGVGADLIECDMWKHTCTHTTTTHTTSSCCC